MSVVSGHSTERRQQILKRWLKAGQLTEEQYQRELDADYAPAAIVVRPKTTKPQKQEPCIHRGEIKGTEECPTCSGHVDVPIFACAIHGECTARQTALGKKFCESANGRRCRDYSQPDPKSAD